MTFSQAVEKSDFAYEYYILAIQSGTLAEQQEAFADWLQLKEFANAIGDSELTAHVPHSVQSLLKIQ